MEEDEWKSHMSKKHLMLKKIINKNIYQNFIDILSNLKYDFSLIEKCKNKILEILNSEDNSNENKKNEEILGFEFLNNHMISFVKIIENYGKSWRTNPRIEIHQIEHSKHGIGL